MAPATSARPAPAATADFVDRRAERTTLREWTDEAWSGSLRIVTVLGDAGVGKSTLLSHLAEHWYQGGATVLAGTCHESLDVPYLPILSALGLGGSRLPEAADGSAVPVRTPELFIDLADQLVRAAQRERTVLLVDDLHWIDPASANLLLHLLTAAAHRGASAPLTLLVVLGTRTGVDDGPSAQLLARLGRLSDARQLLVGPFDELAVNELLEQLLGAPPSRRLLDEVMEATAGNPLFVRTFVEHLAARDQLVTLDGTVGSRGAVLDVPADIDVLLRERLDAVSPQAVGLARLAAHLGDGHSVAELCSVADLTTGAADELLDELEAANLLVERPDGTYHFPHSLIRQQLERTARPRARRALHLQIAERLMRRPDADARMLQIAHHLRRAGPSAPDDLVARFAVSAAERASEVGAWTKSARYAELALERSGDIDDRARTRLHLLAALAAFHDHDARSTAAHCEVAAALARDHDDHDAWAEALLLLHRASFSLGTDLTVDISQHQELVDFVHEYGDLVPPALRARCWQLVAEIASSAGDFEQARTAGAKAQAVAEAIGDKPVLAFVNVASGLTDFQAMRPAAAIPAFTSAVESATDSDRWLLASVRVRLALSRFMAGDIERADEEATRALEVCEEMHHWSEQGLGLAIRSMIALDRGELDRAAWLAEDALQVHTRADYGYIAVMAYPALCYAAVVRGDTARARGVLADWRRSGISGSSRFSVLVDAMTLRDDELPTALDMDRYSPGFDRPLHVFNASALMIDVELAARMSMPHLQRGAEKGLRTLDELGTQYLAPIGASVARLRAMVGVGLNENGSGTELLRRAEVGLRRRGSELEAMRARVERCLALRAGESPDAGPLAVRTASELHERGWYGLVLRLADGFPDAIGDGPRPTRTVIAWDLVSSTELLVASGDVGYVGLIHDLNGIIEGRLGDHHGQAFKYTGDGVYAWFLDAADALRCAAAVDRDLAARNRRADAVRLLVRTGLASGDPVDDDGDLLGVAVVTAARLCGAAEGGTVLCDDRTVALGRGAIPTAPMGPLALKGLGAEVHAHRILTGAG